MLEIGSMRYNSSFEEILGKTGKDYPETERIDRWNLWKKSAIKSKKKYLIAIWTDKSDCEDCIHLDVGNAWCKLIGLPCTVNPIITFKEGVVGMACMGLGKNKLQPNLF